MTRPLAPLVVLTGASSGLGQALARRYAQLGWRLGLIGRQAEGLRHWLESQAIPASQASVYQADVQDLPGLLAAGDACLRELGTPRVVIACAGISVGMDTQERDDLSVMHETLMVNVLGTAATFQPFLAAMKAAGSGRLVGVASVASVRGLPGHGAYCASKAAVLRYCESLRVELRGSGLRVVTLLPGFIDTPMTRGNPYPMPFLMSAEHFAEQAIQAIERGDRRKVIPWPMAWVARLLGWLPDALYDRLFAGRPRKPRRESGSSPRGPTQ